MNKLPEIVSEAWKNKKKPSVFSTVDKQGVPNSIYVNSVSLFNDEKILVADNYFNKTMKNISSGSIGSILFLTEDNKSYQLKGTISYFTEGELFDDMKNWNPTRLPSHGVAVMEIQEVFYGAQKIK